jgi:hypothetical protein
MLVTEYDNLLIIININNVILAVTRDRYLSFENFNKYNNYITEPRILLC